jgi:hypothetical protein
MCVYACIKYVHIVLHTYQAFHLHDILYNTTQFTKKFNQMATISV